MSTTPFKSDIIFFKRSFASRLLYSYILFFFIFILSSNAVFAEGSKELNANGGDRAYLSDLNGSFFWTQGLVRVYVNKDETIYLGSSAKGVYGGKIVLISPSGVYSITTDSPDNTGFIANRNQEINGPLPGSGGYIPFTHKAEEGGVWSVFFIGSTSSIANPNIPVASSSNWPVTKNPGAGNQGDNSGGVAAFDVSVSALANASVSSNFIKGRAYMNVFSGKLWEFYGTFNGIFQVLTNDGYTYKVQANGMAGHGFTFFSNNKGYRNTDGTARYQSENSTEIGNLHDPRMMDDFSTVDITHKLFFNIPASDLPSDAPIRSNNGNPTDPGTSGTTWLKTVPMLPEIRDFKFIGLEGTANVAGTLPLGGFIGFKSNQGGTYTVNIDIDNNGTDAGDVTLTGYAKGDTNLVFWNGKDGSGNKVPNGTINASSIKVSLKAGEVHFPLIDVENNPGGISITRTQDTSSIVYWNDTNISRNGNESSPIVQLEGRYSLNNGHKWGSTSYNYNNFGNNAGLDTWAYLLSNTISSGNSIKLQEADLQVLSLKSDKLTPTYCLGETITYTIEYKNGGPADVTGAKVAFNFPPELTVQSVNYPPSPGVSVSAESQTASSATALVNMVNQSILTVKITAVVNKKPAVGNLNVIASILRPADVNDPDATNSDKLPPTNPEEECNSGTSVCNNIKPHSATIVSSNISIANASVDEGSAVGSNQDMIFKVSLSEANSNCSVSVDYTIVNDPVLDKDFASTLVKTGTLIFAPGEISRTITVPVIQDKMVEGNEVFNVVLSKPIGGQIPVDKATATGTIRNDDFITTIAISGIDGSEGVRDGSFTFSLPEGMTFDEDLVIPFTLGTGSGTAIGNGIDYTPSQNSSITILAGQNSITLDLAIINDGLTEGTETVTITIGQIVNNYGYGIIVPDTPIPEVTITDDDKSTLTISSPIILEGDSGTQELTFNVSLDKPTGSGFNLNFITSDGTTALAGEDYVAQSGAIPFAGTAGEVQKIVILVNGDQKIEKNEAFSVLLSGLTDTFDGHLTYSPSGTGTIQDNDNTPNNKKITITTTDGAEQGQVPGVFTFSFPVGVSADQPTTINFGLGGDASAADYTGATRTSVTIMAGENSGTVSLDVLDDTILEEAELVIVNAGSVTNSGFQTIQVANSPQALNIIDNDFANIIMSNARAVEGNNGTVDLIFDVKLDKPTGSSFTIGFNTADSTALAGEDYIAQSNTLTFRGVAETQQVRIKVKGDQKIEANETLTLNMMTPSKTFDGHLTVNNSPATGIIEDDDNTAANKTITISKTNGYEKEGPNATFIFSFPTGITADSDTEISYTLAGTATGEGVDYTGPISGTIVIRAGDNNATLELPLVDDFILEGNETVVITVNTITSTNPVYTNFTQSSTSEYTLNIIDNDNTILLSSPPTITEGDSGITYVTFSVTLDIQTSGLFSIKFKTNDGTATKDEDYEAKIDTLSFSGNKGEVKYISIPIIGDLKIEANETFIATLYELDNDFGGNLHVSPPVTMTIIDDDNVPDKKLISISKTDGSEDGTPGIFTLSFPPEVTSDQPTTISYTFTGTAIGGGRDYTDPQQGTIIIPADSNYVQVKLNIVDDFIIEGPETVTMTITSVKSLSYAAMAAGNSPHSLAILDNDNTAANNLITLSNVRDGGEGGNDPQFKVSFPSSKTASVPTEIHYTMSGTAANGLDYIPLTGTVVIPENQNSAFITLNVINDKVIEPQEVAGMTLTSATNTISTLTVGPGLVSATIDDDDNIAINTIVTLVNENDGSEPGSNAQFKVSFPSGVTTSVDTKVLYNNTGGTALEGADYKTLSGELTIPAGANYAYIDIQVIDDKIIENLESVKLKLSSATNTVSAPILTVSPSIEVSATITDDDNTAGNNKITVSWIADGKEPGENGQLLLSYPVGISSSEDTKVTYTIGGTAAAGSDYEALTGIATISANTNSRLVDIAVIDDKIIEATETVNLALTAADNMSFNPVVDPTMQRVNLSDDDNAEANNRIILKWTKDGSEPGTPAGFTVGFPDGYTCSKATTINYTIGGTATPFLDYTALSGIVIIPAYTNFVPIDVNVLDDRIIEGRETIALTLKTADNSIISKLSMFPVTAVSAYIEDEDDDIPANNSITLSKTDGGEPGTNARFTVKYPIGFSSSKETTINYTTRGTALAGTDYTALSGTVIIPANTTSADIEIGVIDDRIIEPTENVKLTLTAANNGVSVLTWSPSAGLSADIADDDNNLINNTITLRKIANGSETGVDAQFQISFPDGYTSSVATTVNYVIGGTAVAGIDYTALNGLISIPANSNGAIINVKVVNDQIIEPTETVELRLTSASNSISTFAIEPKTAAVIADIIDDDNVTANKYIFLKCIKNGVEGGINPQFELSFPPGYSSSKPTTVKYKVLSTAVSATPEIDYTVPTGVVLIEANANSALIDISLLNDRIIEPTETIEIVLFDANNSIAPDLITQPEAVSAEISDDDNLAANTVITLSKVADGSEPDTPVVYKVSFPEDYTSAVATTVRYKVSGGTALQGVDYTTLSGEAIIPANSGSAEIPVVVLDDRIIESMETVKLTLTEAANGISPLMAVGLAAISSNITDDDSGEITIIKTNGVEGGPDGSFVFSFPSGVTSDKTTNITYTLGGTATETGPDHDYVPSFSGGLITIPANTESAALVLDVYDDELVEDNETITITNIVTGSSFITLNPSIPVITIADNDEANLTLSGPVTLREGDNGTVSADFEVVLDKGTKSSFNIQYATADGTAQAGDNDYVSNSGILPFTGKAGESWPIHLLINGDKKIERDEAFNVLLSGLSANFNNRLTISETGRTVKIDNDDSGTIVVISKDGSEGGSDASFTFGFSDPEKTADVPVTISYGLIGTALSTGSDYDYTASPAAGIITLPANTKSVKLDLAVLDDQVLEGTETVILAMNPAGLPYGITVDPSAKTANIADNDEAMLTVSNGQVIEGDSGMQTMIFTVKLDKATAKPFTLSYATFEGTAIEDDDYVGRTDTLSFKGTANETQTISIQVKGDQKIEKDETFTVTPGTLSENFNGLLRISSSAAVGTIIDNDNTTIMLSKVLDGDEPLTNARFKVSYINSGVTSTEPIDVLYTIKGTAGNGVDYTALSGNAIIPAGASEAFIDVEVTDDMLVEPIETVTLTLTGASSVNFTLPVQALPVTATISDNDRVVLTVSNPTIKEGNSGTTIVAFNVILSTDTPGGFQVKYNTTDGTATVAGNDYSPVSGTLNFKGMAGETQSINVFVKGDQMIERNETFNMLLELSDTFDGRLTVSESPAIGTILDDDDIPANKIITFTTTDGAEGAYDGSITLSFPSGVTTDSPTTIQFISGGTALGNQDYIVLYLSPAIIPAGITSTSVQIPVMDDAIIEGTETLQIISGVVNNERYTGITVQTPEPVMHIFDNDYGVLTVSSPAVKEGDNGGTLMIFEVKLSTATGTGFTVDYTTEDGTATLDNRDYNFVNGTLVFNGTAGETKTISVWVSGDLSLEDNETFRLVLSGLSEIPGAALKISEWPGVGLILNDDIPPVAVDDLKTTEEDVPITFSVTSNDADVDGTLDPQSLVVITGPVQGTLLLNPDGTFTYTPKADYNGKDSFTYKIRDNNGMESNEAKVILIITSVNDAPVAQDDLFYVLKNGSLKATVKRNDSDPDGDQLNFNVMTSPEKGKLSSFNLVDGSFTYIPDNDFAGIDHFSYKACDAPGLCATAEVTIYVQPKVTVNLTPSADTINEGEITRVTAEITEPLFQDIEIILSYSGSAEQDQDYVLEGDFLRMVIPAGKTSTTKQLVIKSAKDFLKEGDEVVQVRAQDANPSQFVMIGTGSDILIKDFYPEDQEINSNANGDINPDPLASPNGDGIGNENFVIHNIDRYPENEVIIFNRWGNAVYRMKGYNNRDRAFAGVANTGLLVNSNTNLVDGVYFYIIHTKDSMGILKVNKGYVIIKR
ncbi:Calx-beta domain-containing protein [Arcticibacter eurypsychrophilus]|uniref:Calx-beta domain-containing protein n=1 Tax=Arcticibacter eurypsychrophilus TaxID=1434752 RepID=UPI00084D834F|nr:Calx-beta domain-containing protein [Arcticibacter eurypsychrophilus]